MSTFKELIKDKKTKLNEADSSKNIDRFIWALTDTMYDYLENVKGFEANSDEIEDEFANLSKKELLTISETFINNNYKAIIKSLK